MAEPQFAELPSWWESWDTLTRGLLAPEANQLAEVLTRLQANHCPLEGLENWTPSTEGRNRLIAARAAITNHLFRMDQGHDHRALELIQGGETHWSTLRRLAEAFLAGKTRQRQRDIQQQNQRNEVDFRTPLERTAEISVTDPRRFGRGVPGLTIYMDESFHGNAASSDEGVLGGLVWVGAYVRDVLPDIYNHAQNLAENVRSIQEVFNRLLRCDRAFPFVIPIRRPGERAQARYSEIVLDALKLLLGWMLDGRGRTMRVRIFLEEHGGQRAGESMTEFYRGAFREASQFNPERFRGWNIETVAWQSKAFEHLAYGDLLAGLITRTGRNQIGGWSRYRELPGYLPLTPDLVRRVQLLDTFEETRDASCLFELASDLSGTWLLTALIDDVEQRIAHRPDLQQEVLKVLDHQYRSKDRDIPRLNQLTQSLKPLLGSSVNATSPRLQLLQHMVEIERANHQGDPEHVRVAAESYSAIRLTAIQTDPALACTQECILAVHYCDRFEFPTAENNLRWLVGRAFFNECLDERTRGMVLSTLGQTLAMQRRYDEADALFLQALHEFTSAPVPECDRRGECAQTGTYRAINAIDGRFSNAIRLVEDVLGPLPEAASRLTRSTSVAASWQHYLLLRTLCFLQDEAGTLKECCRGYLDGWRDWTYRQEHPWELVEAYRGLLLCRNRPDTSSVRQQSAEHFAQAVMLALHQSHGAVLGLIGRAIAVTAQCCWASPEFRRLDLDAKERAMPMRRSAAGADAMDMLDMILESPGSYLQTDPLAVLPFNYH
jgi:hypothetical protein